MNTLHLGHKDKTWDKMKVGQKVIWDDDGCKHRGKVAKVISGGSQATHKGNLYICQFKTFTRNFDDLSLKEDLELIQ